jgi:hypothetical protein
MKEGADAIKMKTLGEGFGLTREREIEINKIILKTLSEFQKAGTFAKSDVVQELKKLGLTGNEYDFLLVMATTYLVILEQKPQVVIVQEIRKESFNPQEDKGMYE